MAGLPAGAAHLRNAEGRQECAHDKLRALAGIVGVIVSQAASGYAFDSYGGVQGRWGLPQAEARRWTDASFSW
jgi:hypothetical protein